MNFDTYTQPCVRKAHCPPDHRRTCQGTSPDPARRPDAHRARKNPRHAHLTVLHSLPSPARPGRAFAPRKNRSRTPALEVMRWTGNWKAELASFDAARGVMTPLQLISSDPSVNRQHGHAAGHLCAQAGLLGSRHGKRDASRRRPPSKCPA